LGCGLFGGIVGNWHFVCKLEFGEFCLLGIFVGIWAKMQICLFVQNEGRNLVGEKPRPKLKSNLDSEVSKKAF
jgi:hypothetical protein